MTQLRHPGCLIAALILILAPFSIVGATPYQPMANAKGKLGAKIGMVYSTKFRVNGIPNSTGIGVSLGALLDIPVAKRIMSGITVDIHDLHVFERIKKMLDLGVPMKYRFMFTRQRWEMRAVASAGFGYVTAVDKLERTTYLTLKAGFEAVFHTKTPYSLILDGLVIAAPSGGNRDHKVTYGPTFLLRAGFIY